VEDPSITAERGASGPTDVRLASAVAEAAGARVRLFEAEFQRATWTAAYMGAMAIAAALFAVTAWLIFAGSLVYAAATAGMPWWIGAVVVLAAHIAAVVLLMRRIHASVDRLTFAASRRALVRAFHLGRS
jgi:hypothetical protein